MNSDIGLDADGSDVMDSNYRISLGYQRSILGTGGIHGMVAGINVFADTATYNDDDGGVDMDMNVYGIQMQLGYAYAVTKELQVEIIPTIGYELEWDYSGTIAETVDGDWLEFGLQAGLYYKFAENCRWRHISYRQGTTGDGQRRPRRRSRHANHSFGLSIGYRFGWAPEVLE